MNRLIFFLMLGLVAYSLYSGMAYLVRRLRDKSALARLRKTPVLRQLSPSEKQALAAFLKGQKVDDAVRVLSGEYVRHGIKTKYTTTWHDIVDGVEVLLPFDASSFLDTDNKAEVVLTTKHAVVVKLNGFDLLKSYERSQQAQQAQAGWEQAEPGSLRQSAVVTDEPGIAIQAAAEIMAEADSHAVEIVGQRKESAGEIEQRELGFRGGDAAAAWLVALMALWFGTLQSGEIGHTVMLVVAGGAVAWALWVAPRRQSDSQEPAQDVNQVRGALHQMRLINSANGSEIAQRFFIGDQVEVKFPAHWQPAAQGLPEGCLVEVDVRVQDLSVVGFGRGWSVEDEWRRFAPVYWIRYALLCIVALSVLLLWWVSGSDTRANVERLAYSVQLSSSYTDPAALLAHPPRWTHKVQLQGQGRCEMSQTGLSQRLPDENCSHLRWGGTPPKLPALGLPEAVARMNDPAFFLPKDVIDPTALRMLQTLSLISKRDSERSAALAAWVVEQQQERSLQWDDMAQKLEVLDAACETEGGLSAQDCQRIRTKLMTIANGEDATTDWAAFKRQTQPGAAHASLVLAPHEQSAVRAMLADAVDHVVGVHIDTVRDQMQAARGGVVIELPHSHKVRPDTLDQKWWPRPLESWQLLQTNASDAGLHSFAFSGMVKAVWQGEEDGALHIALKPVGEQTSLSRAVVELLLVLLTMGLLLRSAFMLAKALRARTQREKALQADMEKRPQPGSQGFA